MAGLNVELDDGLVSSIANLGAAAAGIDPVVRVPEEPRGVFFTRTKDGGLERHVAYLPNRHAALDVESVVRFVHKNAGEQEGASEFWYNREALTGVVEPAEAGPLPHLITLKTPYSVPFKTLMEWDANRTGGPNGTAKLFKQKELRRLFRTVFLGALDRYPDLLQQVNTLDLEKRVKLESKFTEKGTSMDKSAVAESNMATRLPPVLAFDVPVFQSPNLRVVAPVRAAFEYDTDEEAFVIQVLPGEIEAACVVGERVLLSLLTGEMEAMDVTSPVYYGTPTF